MASNEIQEICLLWGDWQIQRWWSCMSRAEWAAWAQAFAVIGTLIFPFAIKFCRNRVSQRITKDLISQIRNNLLFIEMASSKLKDDNFLDDQREKAEYLSMSWDALLRTSSLQEYHFSKINHRLHNQFANFESSLFNLIDLFECEIEDKKFKDKHDLHLFCTSYSYRFKRRKEKLEILLKQLEESLPGKRKIILNYLKNKFKE
ncbi:MAG: hypothetical protein ACI4QS_10945 [Comamonas sp.]